MAFDKIRILAVAYWPLGGIRTYMKYTYKYLPRDRFDLIILARKTSEEEALIRDAEELGARLIMVKSDGGMSFFLKIFHLLIVSKIHIIQSHGFISAVYVAMANLVYRVPHILTIHGIIEEKLMGRGFARRIKRRLLRFLLNRLTVLYAVSHDILEHVENDLKISGRVKRIVFHNGIDVESFLKPRLKTEYSIRQKLNIPDSIFLIGFVGRFMTQKGFDYLIEAIHILEQKKGGNGFTVLAVGSGDYLDHYKKRISDKGLTHKFIFIPFQRDIAPVYQALDILAMPSIWEACPLQPAEALIFGVPIIASSCIGLKEIVKDTPTIMVPSQDSLALVEAIQTAFKEPPRERFQEFKKRAAERYDVRNTSIKLAELFESLIL
jgi:glycosyltransferase involved in cell wall biosynthesis